MLSPKSTINRWSPDSLASRFSRFVVSLTLLLLMAVAPLGSADAAADEKEDPNELFNSVYGDAFKEAIASADKADDIELAKQLRDAVHQFDLPKSLIGVIGEKVCTLAERAPKAYTYAIETIDKVIEKDATQAKVLNARLIPVLEKAYALGRAGDDAMRDGAGNALLRRLVGIIEAHQAANKGELPDEVDQAIRLAQVVRPDLVEVLEAKRDEAKSMSAAAAVVDALEKKLGADPTDIVTRKKLVSVHLVQRDAPDAAVWFNGVGLDETTRAMLPVAAKDGAGSSPAQLVDLAMWYMNVGDEADDAYKAAMYKRSKKYLDRFAADYDKSDLLNAKAKLSLGKVEGLIKKYESVVTTGPVAPTGTIDKGDTGGVGKLTVKITGDTITDPVRVARLYDQYSRVLRRQYIKTRDGFLAVGGVKFNRSHPSSRHETVSAVSKRLTVYKNVRDGFVVRRIPVAPVPAEAQAVAMGLPGIEPGNYGYVHSAEVVKVVNDSEMLVRALWLIDYSAMMRASSGQDRTERRKLYSQQSRYSRQPIRVIGHSTTGVTVGQRVGMNGNSGKPLQIAIIKVEPNPDTDSYIKTIPVAVTTDQLLGNTVDEKGFDQLIEKRGLTKTDLVNIVQQARRESFKDYLQRAVDRIEQKSGAGR